MRQNQTTIEQMFRSHYVRMFRLARVLLHDDEDSKDAVSDVFSRLMESDILPDSDNMEGYLTVAVRHRCIDIINRRQLRERVERLLPVNMEVAPLDVDHEIRLSEMHPGSAIVDGVVRDVFEIGTYLPMSDKKLSEMTQLF